MRGTTSKIWLVIIRTRTMDKGQRTKDKGFGLTYALPMPCLCLGTRARPAPVCTGFRSHAAPSSRNDIYPLLRLFRKNLNFGPEGQKGPKNWVLRKFSGKPSIWNLIFYALPLSNLKNDTIFWNLIFRTCQKCGYFLNLSKFWPFYLKTGFMHFHTFDIFGRGFSKFSQNWVVGCFWFCAWGYGSI